MPKLFTKSRIQKRETTSKSGSNGAVAAKSHKMVEIPPIDISETIITIVGDRPLMVNNKLSIAEEVAAMYSGQGKAGMVKPKPATPDEQYARAFYTMPDSKYPAPHPKGTYGVPASGIKKCVCKGIRTTGLTDNTTIGLLGNSFWVLGDAGGLCAIQFKKLVRDVRPVNIGSGVKTVPQMRHRPMFHDWKIALRIRYNSRVISEEQLVNLFMYGGQFIGLCEMRAEKKQGECGGFVVSNTR